MADTHGLGPCGRKAVEVQVLLPAQSTQGDFSPEGKETETYMTN